MRYRQYAPADLLRNLVRYYWSLDGRQFSISRLSILSFGDRYPRLIFQDIDCFEPILHDETGEEMPLCYLKGVRTPPTEVFMHGAFSHFGVSFYPHALTTFFGMGADELTNQMPERSIATILSIDLSRSGQPTERIWYLDGRPRMVGRQEYNAAFGIQ